jgi:hypothetical protein
VAGVYVPLLPCSPLATLYTDSTLGTACTGSNGCSNPLSADGNGNYHLYYNPAAGPFTFQYYGPGITPYIQVDQQISTAGVVTPPLALGALFDPTSKTYGLTIGASITNPSCGSAPSCFDAELFSTYTQNNVVANQQFTGLGANSSVAGTANILAETGVSAAPTYAGSGTATILAGFSAAPTVSSGTATELIGIQLTPTQQGAGAVGTWYGALFNPAVGTVATGFNIYANNTYPSYHKGVFSFGTIQSTSEVGIGGGSADLLRLFGVQNPALRLLTNSANASARNFAIAVNQLALGDFGIYQSTTNLTDPISSGVAAFYINNLGNLSFPGNLSTLTGSISSKGMPNVVTFGADPTDAADSGAAFTAACAANSATVGGAVILPQGAYRFTSAVTCPPGTRFIGQGTVGGGPGTGAPNLSTVYLDCYTANLVPFQVGTLGTASYLGVEFDNVTFRDPNGNCGGGLFVPNVSYAVLNNVGFQGFSRGATVAPTTPALTPATTGGSLSAATYYVAISDNDPTEHETLTGTAVSSIVGGTIHGSIALASHTPTSPETCFNVYLGLSASTLHLVAHCQAAGPYTITATATGNVYPPSFDKSPGYGAMFVGGSGGVGLASSYSNQVYINNPQISLGTVNGIICDTNCSEMFVSGGNFNLAANTLGCGIIAGYAHIVTHTEAGGVGSKRICIDGSGGFLDVGLDLLNLSGLTGIAAVGAYGWQISGAASCSNGATLISYTSSSSINVSGLRDNGTCGISPAVASGFNTGSVTLANGPSSFIVTVGTGGAGSTGVITLPGIAPFGWFCQATNTTRAATVSQTANSATSCTLTNYGTTYSATNWTNSDVIFVTAAPF